MKKGEAILSSEGAYTVLYYGDFRMKFRAPKTLEYYTEVKECDNGYLVVMAKYSDEDKPIEEYIDTKAVLLKMRLDANKILKGITSVKIAYSEDLQKLLREE